MHGWQMASHCLRSNGSACEFLHLLSNRAYAIAKHATDNNFRIELHSKQHLEACLLVWKSYSVDLTQIRVSPLTILL